MEKLNKRIKKLFFKVKKKKKTMEDEVYIIIVYGFIKKRYYLNKRIHKEEIVKHLYD